MMKERGMKQSVKQKQKKNNINSLHLHLVYFINTSVHPRHSFIFCIPPATTEGELYLERSLTPNPPAHGPRREVKDKCLTESRSISISPPASRRLSRQISSRSAIGRSLNQIIYWSHLINLIKSPHARRRPDQHPDR
jgi:hypothetical protein